MWINSIFFYVDQYVTEKNIQFSILVKVTMVTTATRNSEVSPCKSVKFKLSKTFKIYVKLYEINCLILC